MEAQHVMEQIIDWRNIRDDFPILRRQVHGKPLTYLDSAASAQKPQMVIDAVSDAYSQHYSNVHRGIHQLSEEATDRFEATRAKIAHFINAPSADEIVLTQGATMSLNIIAHSYGGLVLKEGDEVLISIADHHANIVPWQMICKQTGATLKAAPVEPDGHIDMDKISDMVTDKTRIIAMPHVSNVLGTVYDIKALSELAHAHDAVMVVDGCQGAVHMPVDVQALGCDFYVFSAHKLYGPSGIGMMWGRKDLLADMPPFIGGGSMIDRVTIEQSTYADPPERFEAGTPPIAEAIGFAAAIDYVDAIGMDQIRNHEHDLITYAHQKLSAIDGVRLIGTAPGKSGVISFVMDCAHPHDISTIVDRAGVAIRAGHHCAQPLHDYLDVPATARASVGIYNTRQDLDILAEALEKVKVIFA